MISLTANLVSNDIDNINSDLSEMTDIFSKTPSTLTLSPIMSTGGIVSDGSISGTTYNHTEIISCKPGDVFECFTSSLGNANFVAMACYKNNAFLRDYYDRTYGHSFTIPDGNINGVAFNIASSNSNPVLKRNTIVIAFETDKTLTQENESADAKVTGERLNHIDDNLNEITDIFNETSTLTLSPIMSTGGIVSDGSISGTTYNHTEIILCKPGDIFECFSSSMGNGNFVAMACYKNNVFLRDFYNTTYGHSFIIPSGDIDGVAFNIASSNSNPILKKKQLKSRLILIDSKCITVEMHSEYFYYYCKTDNRKIFRYKFIYTENQTDNVKMWNQRNVDLLDSELNLIEPIITEGEWEMAIEPKDSPDFIGGKIHGSEKLNIANFYFDGHKESIVDGKIVHCDEILINITSDMYDPSNDSSIIGKHYKEYIITNNNIKITQKVIWLSDVILKTSYLAMLPAVRGNDSVTPNQVTDKIYDNISFDEYDISTTDVDSYMTSHTYKGTKIVMYGTELGVSISLECLIKNPPSSIFGYLRNVVQYNKYYFGYNDSSNETTMRANDKIEWTSTYKLNYRAI